MERKMKIKTEMKMKTRPERNRDAAERQRIENNGYESEKKYRHTLKKEKIRMGNVVYLRGTNATCAKEL